MKLCHVGDKIVYLGNNALGTAELHADWTSSGLSLYLIMPHCLHL